LPLSLDFGFAQYLKPAKEGTDMMRGSPLYMAPEMFLSGQYTCVVDLWSVGVILYEALYGRAPFASFTWTELEEKIKDDKPIHLPDIPHVSSSCRELLTGLLQRDPKERITFTQFFDHPFIDLEHVPAPDSLNKACSLVTKAVEKDSEGDYPYAAQLYCAALDYFLPAIQFESEEERKQTLRSKIKEYIDRVEQLKVIIRKATREPQTQSTALEAAIQRHKELKASVHKVKDAEKADDRGQLELSLQLYQDALEGAISILPTLKREEQESLRPEVERWLKRAEEIKLYLEIQTSKKESDFESEKSFSVKTKGKSLIQYNTQTHTLHSLWVFLYLFTFLAECVIQ
jgi:serine/threonine-protein kinase ULK/ATG1